jgi:hypothetical protein
MYRVIITYIFPTLAGFFGYSDTALKYKNNGGYRGGYRWIRGYKPQNPSFDEKT